MVETKTLVPELQDLTKGSKSSIETVSIVNTSDTEQKITVVVATTIMGTKDEVVKKIKALIKK